MQALFAQMRRLHDRGSRSCGLVVDAEGVMLGPDCELVRRTPQGFRRAGAGQIAWIKRNVFAGDPRLHQLEHVLAAIARALDAGDLAKAQLLGLELPLDRLDDKQLRRLRFAADLMKAGFDPDEPRNDHGRWANTNGTTAATQATAQPETAQSISPPTAAGTAASDALAIDVGAELGALAPRLAPLMGEIAGSLGAAGTLGGVAIFGAVVVPFSNPNVAQGELTDIPGVAYNYDEGILTLYVSDGAGNRLDLFHGSPGLDGLYRDAAGNVVARQLQDGKGFVLNPDALPGLAAAAKPKVKDLIDQDAVAAALRTYADAIARSEPKLCPDATPDRGANPSLRASLYQWQICHMPPGYGVEFAGARYDFCYPATGDFAECKGPGFEDWMEGSPEDVWPWERWIGEISDTGIRKMVDQMREQNFAAGGRNVFWFVAEKPVAEWLANYAKRQGFSQIHVFHVPALPFDPAMLRRKATSILAAESWETWP